MEGYRGDEKENYHMVQELGESRMGRREKNCRGNNKRIGNWLSGRMNAPRVAANLAVFEHRREPEERERSFKSAEHAGLIFYSPSNQEYSGGERQDRDFVSQTRSTTENKGRKAADYLTRRKESGMKERQSSIHRISNIPPSRIIRETVRLIP